MASKQATVLASALVIICLIVLSSGGVKCQTPSPSSSDCHFITANCETNADCDTICSAQGYSRGVCAEKTQCCCIIT
ncbi:hypothetical protein COLO4_30381 [Corchorus olitorius]|uniref:Uncharacterized protein n=1 Tax=Corchorus olitorius TaxID=93759 RepID=A0A1R3H8U9_9ROSI|nr:hypothetical protein COLO4_30381 [Corchorus olitorius]